MAMLELQIALTILSILLLATIVLVVRSLALIGIIYRKLQDDICRSLASVAVDTVLTSGAVTSLGELLTSSRKIFLKLTSERRIYLSDAEVEIFMLAAILCCSAKEAISNGSLS